MPFNFFSGDPQNQAMLALAAGLLESGGPSRQPVDIGQGAARGMMAGREAFMQAQQAQMKQKYLDMQMAQFEQAQAEKQRQQDALNALRAHPQMGPYAHLLGVDTGAAIERAFPKPVVLAGDAQLVNPAKPEGPPLATNPKPMKPTANIQDYEYAVKQGYKGTLQDFVLEQKKASATNVTQTVGAKEADKKFAEEFIPFATGGYADIVKQLDQLREQSNALKTETGITGPVVGNVPRSVRNVTNPRSVAVQEAVEEVVQRNLRLILGAQFTEKEGERLISRAYNPVLLQEENKKRVDRLIKQIQSAAEAKLDASRYFMAHGTLEGWKGKLWKLEDFNPDTEVRTPSARNVIRYDKNGRRIP